MMSDSWINGRFILLEAQLARWHLEGVGYKYHLLSVSCFNSCFSHCRYSKRNAFRYCMKPCTHPLYFAFCYS